MKPTSVYILDDEESKMVDRIKLYIKSRIEDGMRLKGITDEVEEDKEDVSIRKEGIRIVREMKRYIDAKKAMKSSATTGEGGSSHDKLEERTIKDTQILNSNKKATTSEGGSSHDQLEERTIKELTQILNSNQKAISDRMDLLTTRMGTLEEKIDKLTTEKPNKKQVKDKKKTTVKTDKEKPKKKDAKKTNNDVGTVKTTPHVQHHHIYYCSHPTVFDRGEPWGFF